MNPKPEKTGDGERNLRDISVSRRGGVRTRGGRLPPINMRNITQVIGTKKVVAPNIPQRRVVKNEAKQETHREPLQMKAEPKDNSRPRRGRSTKVFLQTEGSFLAEGPAARIKREQVGSDVSFYLPRVSVKASESETKYDSAMIKDVLSSYDAKSFYDDDFCDKPPHRFPLLKQQPFPKIKPKIDEEDDYTKMKIKKEDSEDAEIVDSKTHFTKSLETTEYFRDVENDSKLILLKLPSHLHFMKQEVAVDSGDKEKSKVESELKETGIDKCLDEGFIGKMRFMRSGLVKLMLGEIELELTDDKPLDSHMEAATIRIQQDVADLNILGKIERKVVLSPIVNKLVKKGY